MPVVPHGHSIVTKKVETKKPTPAKKTPEAPMPEQEADNDAAAAKAAADAAQTDAEKADAEKGIIRAKPKDGQAPTDEASKPPMLPAEGDLELNRPGANKPNNGAKDDSET